MDAAGLGTIPFDIQKVVRSVAHDVFGVSRQRKKQMKRSLRSPVFEGGAIAIYRVRRIGGI